MQQLQRLGPGPEHLLAERRSWVLFGIFRLRNLSSMSCVGLTVGLTVPGARRIRTKKSFYFIKTLRKQYLKDVMETDIPPSEVHLSLSPCAWGTEPDTVPLSLPPTMEPACNIRPVTSWERLKPRLHQGTLMIKNWTLNGYGIMRNQPLFSCPRVFAFIRPGVHAGTLNF